MEDISRNTSENIKENNDISGNNDNGKIARIKELVKQLNDAAKKYYMEDTEIMSNLEYDALYDELSALEKETGMVMSNSPTVKVGYEVVSELPKEAHEHPMLSLLIKPIRDGIIKNKVHHPRKKREKSHHSIFLPKNKTPTIISNKPQKIFFLFIKLLL